MRVVKEAKERRNEILDHAISLFVTKGYDNTSVEDIVREVGIAKGTLYYHFKSKEDILDGIINRILENTIERAMGIAHSDTLNVHEKMLHTLLALQVRETFSVRIIEEMHKPQNALMHQKMLQRVIRDITPVLTGIIEEGIKLGIFHTEFPYESAELFMTYGNVIFDPGFMDFKEEELGQKITAFIANMERVLGADIGSMSYVAKMFEEKGED